MSAPHVLIPLQIPELGPSLGKLVTGTKRPDHGVPLDSIRVHLVSRLIECAGEARRLAATGERAAALAALGREAWLAAWDEAVAAAGSSLVDALGSHLDQEARAVRMPAGLRSSVALDATERRAVVARLGAAGAEMVLALDALDEYGSRLVNASNIDRRALEEWQDALTRCARRLEAAWLGLEKALDGEVSRWLAVGDEIAQWRRPVWPVLSLGGLLMGVVTWFGLIWGGILPVPAWMNGVVSALGRLWP